MLNNAQRAAKKRSKIQNMFWEAGRMMVRLQELDAQPANSKEDHKAIFLEKRDMNERFVQIIDDVVKLGGDIYKLKHPNQERTTKWTSMAIKRGV